MRSGWSSASIFWVLLAWGRFPVSKAIIPDAQEHFLTPSAHRDTHLFGGLGAKLGDGRWDDVTPVVFIDFFAVCSDWLSWARVPVSYYSRPVNTQHRQAGQPIGFVPWASATP